MKRFGDLAAGSGLVVLAGLHLYLSRDKFRAALDLWRRS